VVLCGATVAGVACGRAHSDSPPGTKVTGDIASVEAAPDAAPVAEQCPAPGRIRADEFCPARQTWARNPDTRACCLYENECVAPNGWAVFGSAEECASSCRCESYEFPEGINPRIAFNLQYRIEHSSLECACPGGNCANGLDHLDRIDAQTAEACNSFAALSAEDESFQPTVSRLSGCGMIAFEVHIPGYPGALSNFDEASGALIGTRIGSDTTSPPCGTFQWVAGRDFVCDEVQTCAICGTAADPLLPPPCE